MLWFGTMGRIKTKLIKRLTFQLLAQHREALTTEFGPNKLVVGRDLVGASKKMRNVVAGYATRKMRRVE